MCEPRPGVVRVGEAVVPVELGRDVSVEAEYSTDGGMDSFLLFGRWGKDSSGEMVGRQRV